MASGAVELSAQTARLAVTPAPAGKPGGPGLWRVKGMELPPYFQNVRNALIRSGHTPADAYRITWGAIRRWARGGGKAHPEVVAAAQAALADLKAKAAIAHSHANDGEAITLAGMFNEALHPRVAAGNTGGGRFTSGQGGQAAGKQPAVKHPAMKRPGPSHGLGQAAQRAAQAHQLRAQAAKYRDRANQLKAEIRAEVGQIAAAVALQKSAKASAAKSAKAAASGKKAAKKVAAKTSTKAVKKTTATHKVTVAQRAAAISGMRGKVGRLRLQVRALDAEANKLDRQAAAL